MNIRDRYEKTTFCQGVLAISTVYANIAQAMISRWLNDEGNWYRWLPWFYTPSEVVRLVYPTPDHDLPHIYALECDTGSCISAHYYLATNRNPYASGL
jgi:hypothetical protein